MPVDGEGARPSTATRALDIAQDAKAEIESHEKLCAIRYEQIGVDIRGIRNLLKWAATSMIGAVGALALFGVQQWVAANNADHNLEVSQREAQRAQIQFLQSQIQTLVSQLKPQTPVVVNNPPATQAIDPLIGPPVH